MDTRMSSIEGAKLRRDSKEIIDSASSNWIKGYASLMPESVAPPTGYS